MTYLEHLSLEEVLNKAYNGSLACTLEDFWKEYPQCPANYIADLISTLGSEYSDLQCINLELVSKNERLDEWADQLSEEKQELGDTIENLEDENSSLKEELNSAEHRATVAEGEVEILTMEVVDLENKLNAIS